MASSPPNESDENSSHDSQYLEATVDAAAWDKCGDDGSFVASSQQVKMTMLRRDVMVFKTVGSGPLHVRAADGGGVNRQGQSACSDPRKLRKPQVKNRFCKPICKPDAAGQAEMAEMRKAGDDLTPQVGRGQCGDQRLPETAETRVVWLITQSPQVQILPPLPRSEAGSESGSGFLRCEVVALSDRLSGSLLRSIPGTTSGSW
jgi:hypothetical protein